MGYMAYKSAYFVSSPLLVPIVPSSTPDTQNAITIETILVRLTKIICQTIYSIKNLNGYA